MEWRRKSLISKGMATKLFEMRCNGKAKRGFATQRLGMDRQRYDLQNKERK